LPLLFSYGTLRDADVQVATFGRLLAAHPDELVGYEQAVFRVDDPKFVAKSGRAEHAIVRFTGRAEDRVRGTVLELTEDELTRADQYEPAGYQRVCGPLASGGSAWVYAAPVPTLRHDASDA
jgi:hypothetical protein